MSCTQIHFLLQFVPLKAINTFKCLYISTLNLKRYHSCVVRLMSPKYIKMLLDLLGYLTRLLLIMSGVRYTNINRQYCIETGLTVLHQQQQHYSEGMGGNFRFSIIKLFHNICAIYILVFSGRFPDKTRRYLFNKTSGEKCGC